MEGPDEDLVHVGWWCWRCTGLVSMPCRSDNVPIYVPKEWAEDFRNEVVNER